MTHFLIDRNNRLLSSAATPGRNPFSLCNPSLYANVPSVLSCDSGDPFVTALRLSITTANDDLRGDGDNAFIDIQTNSADRSQQFIGNFQINDRNRRLVDRETANRMFAIDSLGLRESHVSGARIRMIFRPVRGFLQMVDQWKISAMNINFVPRTRRGITLNLITPGGGGLPVIHLQESCPTATISRRLGSPDGCVGVE
jgi:hypothetical protein